MKQARFRIAILILLAGTIGACASGPPVGATRIDPRTAHHHLTANALSTGQPSAPTEQLLRRLGLFDRFGSDPAGTIAELHAGVTVEDGGRLFALAELSYLHGQARRDRACLLSSAVYAWAFLFPGSAAAPPEPFDPRLRVATDLYNRGLGEGLIDDDGETVRLEGRTVALPLGSLEIEPSAPSFLWAGYELHAFRSAADLHVRGLRNRYRQPGIGSPMAAGLTPAKGPVEAPPGARRIAQNLRVPVTALLRIEQPRAALVAGRLHGILDVYSQDDAKRIEVDGIEVPLEFETTSTLALALQESDVWAFETGGFLSSSFRPEAFVERPDGLLFLRPWRTGRIPVVLVHGTASSPARWAELVNELENDPRIWNRFQIWLFMYNTGNPVALSGALLREAILETLAELDPEERDPALQQAVVIGHSQGGLLTKLTAIDPGTRLWDGVSDRPLDEMDVSEKTRDLLRRALYVEPVRAVKRVVFVSTPHRGSFLNSVRLAGWQPSRWLSGLVKLPGNLLAAGADLVNAGGGLTFDRIPTSIDNMTPGNPFLETLAEIPVRPGVVSHSIIPVKGDGPYEEGNDGVVEYRSAHVEDVESELVVRSGHSTQATWETIEEIRRILFEHAAGTGLFAD